MRQSSICRAHIDPVGGGVAVTVVQKVWVHKSSNKGRHLDKKDRLVRNLNLMDNFEIVLGLHG